MHFTEMRVECAIITRDLIMAINLKQALIENDSVRLGVTAANWEEAIRIGTEILEKTGAITPNYHQTIVKSIKEHGPYVILAPGLAMPHARPEDGVVRTAFALVTLTEPVYFEGDLTPIDVFLTLAGADSETHLVALRQVMEILDDEDSETGVNLDRVRDCKTKEDIYAMIDKYSA